MHLLQRHILKKLTLKEGLRYKDLKPKEIDGNQFMYHLGVLIKNGLLEKRGLVYLLTTSGKMYADRVNLETFLPREQPKITTMIYCANKKGELLLFRRLRSPLFNLLHMPYGKLHMGETVREAAVRELKEKTGLTANLSYVGDIYVRVYDGSELIAHVLHHMFVGKNPKGELLEKTDAGVPLWHKNKTFPKKEMVGGFFEMKKIIERNTGKFFFKEFDLHLPKNNSQT